MLSKLNMNYAVLLSAAGLTREQDHWVNLLAHSVWKCANEIVGSEDVATVRE